MTTLTREPIRRGPAGARPYARLVFVATADRLELASSLHALDELDEVQFRRGPRRCERRGRALVLALPDERMSSDHGALRRRGERWILDDPRSKNAAVVDGVVTRLAELADGAVIELGHSVFLLRSTPGQPAPLAHLTGDMTADRLPAPAPGMATFAPRLARDLAALARLAAEPLSIVLHGETGTGKEVIARAIHALSGRGGELVAINCGALPASLIEAELFGHRRGAYTGALGERRGLVRSAHRGTLFLDEIGELPAPAQATLLRVIQEGEVLPIGEDQPVAVDVRIVAATLHDLDAAVAEGRFRADLHARLAGHVLELPPLRDRREDLGLLLAALLPRVTGEAVRFAPSALAALLRHDWPYNIRELEQTLRSATALAAGRPIELEHLPRALREPPAAPPPDPAAPPDLPAPSAPPASADREPPAAPLLDPADRELRAQLVALLAQHDGNVVAVAAALGKQRAQIYKWVKRLGIDLDAYRRSS